jgi:hypothetical protein
MARQVRVDIEEERTPDDDLELDEPCGLSVEEAKANVRRSVGELGLPSLLSAAPRTSVVAAFFAGLVVGAVPELLRAVARAVEALVSERPRRQRR